AEDDLHQRPSATLTAEIRVEIEPVELRRGLGVPLHADRSDDPPVPVVDEERPSRRPVVAVERQEVRNLRQGIPHEAVLGEDARDEIDHAGDVRSLRRDDAEVVALHGWHGSVGRRGSQATNSRPSPPPGAATAVPPVRRDTAGRRLYTVAFT